PQFPAQDCAARRRHAAHLRDRRILSRRDRPERRLDRTGCAQPRFPRAGAGCRTAGARGRIGDAHYRRPDARTRQGRARLSGLTGDDASPWCDRFAPCWRRQRNRTITMLRGLIFGTLGLATVVAVAIPDDAYAGGRWRRHPAWVADTVLYPGWGYYSYPWGY